MNPIELGQKYDRIAHWWHEQHGDSDYGVAQFGKALGFVTNTGTALDVGCGTGGRFVRVLEKWGFTITGLDISDEMITLAEVHHPEHRFFQADICCWDTRERFDFIFAWDSIFHLPYEMHKPVVSKMCDMLNPGGVLMYSFGDAEGEHTDTWLEDTFYYSSIGINENLKLLIANGLSVLHLELDQYPEKHVYVIARKPEPALMEA